VFPFDRSAAPRSGKARREKFLLPRYVEQYLDLFAEFGR
jgi:hypothetical protein